MFQKGIFLLLLCLSWVAGNAQLTGRVISEDSTAISGVMVRINDAVLTTTDASGSFQFYKDISLPVQLFLSHPDYFSEVIQWNQNSQVIQLTNISENNALATVVLSATYQKESNVLIPTETITEKNMGRFAPIDLVNAINQTPGIYIQSGGINTNRITIRGVGSRTLFSTNKIRAYFNGIPIPNGAGETNIDIYDPNSIENLEIVKGPKATQYGTNLGGTLLLSTKELPTEGVATQTSFTAGSFGLLKNTSSIRIKDKKLNLTFNYDHLQLEGYRQNSNYNRNSYLLYSEYRFTTTFTLGVLLHHYANIAHIASSLGRTNFTEDPSQAAFTWGEAQGFEDNRETLTGLSFQNKLSESFSNTTTVYYRYLDHYEPRPFNILDEITNGYGARTFFAKEFDLKKRKAVWSFGAEGYTDEYKWKTIENNYEDNTGNGSLPGDLISQNVELRNQLNVFTTTILPLTEKLKTEVGLNFNTTSYNFKDQFNSGIANKSATRNFEGIWAPNVSLRYIQSPNWNLFGNVSCGFNFPSIEETLTPDGVINPEIGPEIGWNYEIGTVNHFFKNQLSIKASAYLLSIKDLLVAERVGNDEFIGRNAGKTEHKGVEMGISYKFTLLPNLNVSSYVNADFNFHKFIDFVDGDEDFSGNELTGVPNKKVAAGMEVRHTSGWYVLGNILYVGTAPITDSNSLYSDAYNVINIKAGYKKTILKNLELSLSGGINNVGDKHYASSILINASSFGSAEPRYFYPGNPVNYYGTLQLSYTLK